MKSTHPLVTKWPHQNGLITHRHIRSLPTHPSIVFVLIIEQKKKKRKKKKAFYLLCDSAASSLSLSLSPPSFRFRAHKQKLVSFDSVLIKISDLRSLPQVLFNISLWLSPSSLPLLRSHRVPFSPTYNCFPVRN